jgi:hypothetical protein
MFWRSKLRPFSRSKSRLKKQSEEKRKETNKDKNETQMISRWFPCVAGYIRTGYRTNVLMNLFRPLESISVRKSLHMYWNGTHYFKNGFVSELVASKNYYKTFNTQANYRRLQWLYPQQSHFISLQNTIYGFLMYVKVEDFLYSFCIRGSSRVV